RGGQAPPDQPPDRLRRDPRRVGGQPAGHLAQGGARPDAAHAGDRRALRGAQGPAHRPGAQRGGGDHLPQVALRPPPQPPRAASGVSPPSSPGGGTPGPSTGPPPPRETRDYRRRLYTTLGLTVAGITTGAGAGGR